MVLMNSKSEYNRCTIPRICTKSEKEKQEENEKVIEDEKRMKNEISSMRKNKKREKMTQEENGIMVEKGRKRQKVCVNDTDEKDENDEIGEKYVEIDEKIVESYDDNGGVENDNNEKMMNDELVGNDSSKR